MKRPGKTLLELVMPDSLWEDQTPETQSRWTAITCRVIATDHNGDFRNPESIGDACRLIDELNQQIEGLKKRYPTPLEIFTERNEARAEADRLRSEVERLRDRERTLEDDAAITKDLLDDREELIEVQRRDLAEMRIRCGSLDKMAPQIEMLRTAERQAMDAVIVEVGAMSWPRGAAYCAQLVDALDALDTIRASKGGD